jgi:CHAT domain-containing protein
MRKVNFLTVIFLISGLIIPVSAKAEDINLSHNADQQISQNINTPSLSKNKVVAEREEIWKKEYEKYFRGTFPQKIMNYESISSTLRRIENQTGKKSAVVYMIPTDQQLELLVITPQKNLIQKSIPAANKDALLKIIKKFKTEISSPSRVNTNSYLASAQQLHKLLISPIEKDLKAENIDTLLFCVGVGLRSLPFAALHDGNQFLIEKYSISLIPAFSLTDTRYADIRNFSVLAMGSSEFQNLEPLPAVPIELSTIVKTQGGISFLNNQFTIKNLRLQQTKKPHKIIHLATHGIFNPGEVNNSFIQFWNQKLLLNQLKYLQLNNLTVELLVLSACTTALGDEQAELGFSGLAVEAGVKSAIGSFWSVSDVGTLALMAEFYQHLKTSPIKAEALRQAQIAMIKKQIQIKQGQLQQSGSTTKIPLPPEIAKLDNLNLSHPYYWSGFTIIGSPW